MKTILIIASIAVIWAVKCDCATRVNFPGCDRQGWKCTKVQISPIRYLIEYVCTSSTPDVMLTLWNFNAPAEIKHLKIENCTSIEIDLTCTNVGRLIESIHIKNVGVLNFTNILYKDTTQLPETVIIEHVSQMPLIPEKTFKQMKTTPANAYRCAVNLQPTNSITFRHVQIDTIAQNAFHNLTEVKNFTWTNVSVENMEPLAMRISMEKFATFNITNSSFHDLDHKSFQIRSPSVSFESNRFDRLRQNVVDAISFRFDFIRNRIERVDSFAFLVLSKDVTFSRNRFDFVKTSAFQGIGPGLLENAQMSFGKLQFTYDFVLNRIDHSDVGGLNPDWIAYKNVHSYIQVKLNKLPCSCKELGWISIREGFGETFSKMMSFNSHYLDSNNNNLCLDAPCNLTLSVMTAMCINFGKCGAQEPSMDSWCKKYNPNNTKDLGLGKIANLVLNNWKNEFPRQEIIESPIQYNEDDLNDIFDLSRKTEDVFYDSNKNPSNYFKIEHANVFNDSLIEPQPQDEAAEEVDIKGYFAPEFAYNTTTGNGNETTTKNGTIVSSVLQKEYEDGEKNLVKESQQQWQTARRKRMLYFKLYGKMMRIN